jgi:hypothetical protein
MDRVTAPLLAKIANDERLLAHEIPLGCSVKLAGVWHDFDGWHEVSGLMHVTRRASSFTYRPQPGELFEWSAPF